MSTGEMIVVAAIALMFVVFAAGLAWGWSQTRDLH